MVNRYSMSCPAPILQLLLEPAAALTALAEIVVLTGLLPTAGKRESWTVPVVEGREALAMPLST
jgi:hypothetical protein